MKTRKLSTFLLTAIMASAVIAGCGSKTSSSESIGSSGTSGNNASSKSENILDTSESGNNGLSKATQVKASDLPIKGIGTTVSTDIKASKDYKIGYIAKNTTNPYMVAQGEGVKKAAEDMGFEAIVQAPSTADSVEEQVQIMENMIQQKVDVIIVHCADSNGIMPGVREAEKAGVLVETIGTPAATDTFLRTGVDYYETGYSVAEDMAKKLDGKGNLIILEGPAGAANAIERLNGINDALKNYPDIKVVASQTANFKRREGMSVTENLLQKYTDIQGIIGCNDESALGAIQALKAADKTGVLVAGFDGSVDAANAIKSGDMFESYNTDPYGSGYIACAYAVQYLNDGTEPQGKFIPFPSSDNDPLITADNVDEYIENYAWFNAVQN